MVVWRRTFSQPRHVPGHPQLALLSPPPTTHILNVVNHRHFSFIQEISRWMTSVYHSILLKQDAQCRGVNCCVLITTAFVIGTQYPIHTAIDGPLSHETQCVLHACAASLCVLHVFWKRSTPDINNIVICCVITSVICAGHFPGNGTIKFRQCMVLYITRIIGTISWAFAGTLHDTRAGVKWSLKVL